MIARGYIHFYDEIFALPGFLQDPCLIIGHQWIESWPGRPPEYDFPTVNAMMKAKGVHEVVDVDLFNPKADSHHDLNTPFPASWDAHFGTVFDAGTVEHVFDTATALRNCLFAVRPAGFCVFHVPVRGFYLHGLHTFSPELLPALVEANGFEVKYLRYSTPEGRPVEIEDDVPDLLQWLVARRIPGPRPNSLQHIQQGVWVTGWVPRDR
jgi:SAM-dependent methyltransferase